MGSDHWLRQRREALGITQEELAERLTASGLKLTKAAISKWEQGKTPLPLQTSPNRQRIASALELSIPELLVFEGYEIDTDLSHDSRLVATLYETLSPEDRETILMMVNHLKSKQSGVTTAFPAKTSMVAG